MTRRQQALEFFVAQGWTLAQAAGIVANLEAESGLHPDAVGDGGRAYGIAQWHPDRQAIFAGMMGEPVQGSSFEDQLYFVHAELQGAEKRAGELLAACTTAAGAGDCVSRYYERPADREGEATKRAALAERIFQAYDAAAQDGAGEAIPPPLAPSPDLGQIPTQPESPMGPFAFLPMILQILGLTGALGRGEKGQQNVAAAQVVVDAFTRSVPGAVNEQDAITRAQSNPAVASAAKAAVLAEPAVQALISEAGGGGIAGARKAAADATAPPFYRTAPFWISILLLIIVYAVVASVLWQTTVWRPEDRSQILMLAVAISSGVMGYFLGSSIGSARKDNIIAGQQ